MSFYDWIIKRHDDPGRIGYIARRLMELELYKSNTTMEEWYDLVVNQYMLCNHLYFDILWTSYLIEKNEK